MAGLRLVPVARSEEGRAGCDNVATGTTRGRIAGDGADMLIFFVDPLTAMPHDVDVKAPMRLAIDHEVFMALDPATAEILLEARLAAGDR